MIDDGLESSVYDAQRLVRVTSLNGLMKCLSVAANSDSGCFSRIIALIALPNPFLQ